MPRIRCHYLDCVYLDEGFCSARKIELDPESGCLTFRVESLLDADEWEEDDELDDDWDEFGFSEEDEEDWMEDEDL